MKPLSRAELLALPPVIDLPTLGRALGLSAPVTRERARRDEFDALGIRVVKLGAQRRVVTASVLAFLGIGGTSGDSTAQPQASGRGIAHGLRSVGSDGAG